MNYYLDEDYEVSGLQKIMPKELLNLIDLSKWNIVYYRENINRKTIHNKHPYHNRKHSHKLGYLLLQKTLNIKTKRMLNRTYKKGSRFGEPDQQVYDYINFFKTRYNTILDCLVVDANDGKNVFPFAINNFNVTCYEDNEILLNGGIFNHTYTIGLNKRIVDSKLNNITVKNLNYYEVKEIKKYDFVYVSLSLNEEKHNILTNELINKGYIEKGDFQIYYYDKLFQELLEEKNSYKDLFTIIHYIVPRVVSRNFKDEDGYLIENKFGYFKNAIYSNINKLNFDIDSLWDNDLNDLYSEDDFER